MSPLLSKPEEFHVFIFQSRTGNFRWRRQYHHGTLQFDEKRSFYISCLSFKVEQHAFFFSEKCSSEKSWWMQQLFVQDKIIESRPIGILCLSNNKFVLQQDRLRCNYLVLPQISIAWLRNRPHVIFFDGAIELFLIHFYATVACEKKKGLPPKCLICTRQPQTLIDVEKVFFPWSERLTNKSGRRDRQWEKSMGVAGITQKSFFVGIKLFGTK